MSTCLTENKIVLKTKVFLKAPISNRIFTKYPKVSDFLQGAPHVAARLEAAPVGVDVHMADGLLYPDAETQRTPSVGVEDVHEVGVIWREAPVGVFALKVRSGWIQTFRKRKAMQ